MRFGCEWTQRSCPVGVWRLVNGDDEIVAEVTQALLGDGAYCWNGRAFASLRAAQRAAEKAVGAE